MIHSFSLSPVLGGEGRGEGPSVEWFSFARTPTPSGAEAEFDTETQRHREQDVYHATRATSVSLCQSSACGYQKRKPSESAARHGRAIRATSAIRRDFRSVAPALERRYKRPRASIRTQGAPMK